MTTPSHQTRAWAKKRRFHIGKVEHFDSNVGEAGIMRDLFGFVDYVMLDTEKERVVYLQVTSRNQMSTRQTKILTSCRDEARAIVRCGGVVEVWGWDKFPMRKKDGTKGMLRWRCKRARLSPDGREFVEVA